MLTSLICEKVYSRRATANKSPSLLNITNLRWSGVVLPIDEVWSAHHAAHFICALLRHFRQITFRSGYQLFSDWLYASGYSSKNVSDHLGRLRQVLEHSADTAPDGERSYRRFLDSQGPLVKSSPRINPISRTPRITWPMSAA